MHRLLLLLLAITGTLSLSAQSSFQFTGITANSADPDSKTVLLDVGMLRKELAKAPVEYTRRKSNASIDLPLPNGEMLAYKVWDADLLPNDKALGSYRVINEFGSGRIAIGPSGISGVVQGPDGHFIIEAIDAAAGLYAVSTYADFMAEVDAATGPLSCGYDDHSESPDFTGLELNEAGRALRIDGAAAGAMLANAKAGNVPTELRVYDFVMTNTGEFAQKVGGTTEAVREAFNTATSALNAILEPQVGVRMNLLDIPELIYLDPSVDPFINADNGGGLLNQVLPAFVSKGVGVDQYDLGHLFTAGCTDVGGVVSGRACDDDGKTRGITCVSGTVLGAAMGTMAHEVAHQFTVSHSWNNCPGVDGQRAGNTAFEPGAGNTIMSYARACGNQNIGGRDPYYHVGSIEQFLFFTRDPQGGAFDCATVMETGNVSPEVTVENFDGLNIPIETPFRLRGTATDENGDDILYNWEQFDLGPASDIRDPRGNAPLFRSVPPTADGNVRYFPNLGNIVNNISSLSEMLPDYERDMTFRLTAHDFNEEAGGVDWGEVAFSTDETAGPFVVNNPTNELWRVGDYQEVTWDVAGTDGGDVNCSRVNVLMSIDEGETFDIVLAREVPNNGRAFVTVPEAAISGDARIMIEAVDNIFLNINDTDFRVAAATAPGYTLETSLRYQELCLPNTLSVGLSSSSILGFDEEISLSVLADELPVGTEVTFSETEINPGESTNLQIDFENVRFTGVVTLTVLAVTPTLDTARREIVLDVVDNDFSDLATISPEEGTNGIVLRTDFDWTTAANAEDYEIQIATSPTFAPGTIFEQEAGLRSTEYMPTRFFTENTLYFWRIRPRNRCGFGDWNSTNSFRTVDVDCNDYAMEGDVIRLPGSGRTFKVESRIFIEDQGTIDDVNLPNINVNYNFVSKLNVRLISPAGTVVDLYKQSCPISTNVIDLGFDDDAPDAIVCPPNQKFVHMPVGRLSDFNGEGTFGEWILEVEVTEAGGSSGAINSWNIQFCTSTTPEAPARIANNTTFVPPLASNIITQANLRAQSTEFATNEVVYQLTELPKNGMLSLYGTELSLGDTWRQVDIDLKALVYQHTVAGTEDDFFGIVVTTPNGGYLPIVNHNIVIDEDAVVISSNRDVSDLEAGLEVFPNPVAGELTVRWSARVNRPLTVQLFDLNGRMLQTKNVEGIAGATELNTSGLASGVYLLRIDGAVRRIVKQ